MPERKRLWPLTIKAYAIGFIILMSLVFGILGWAVQYKLATISTAAKIHNTKSAKEELAYALSHIIDEINQRADNLALQDETHQQLANPAYYGYWRDNRVRGAGVLPAYTQAIEIYTAQGKSLAAHPTHDMPTNINRLNSDSFLTRQGNHYYLYVFHPIPSIDKHPDSPLLGYLGFKLDFAQAVNEEQRFSYIDPGSIHIKIEEQEHLPLSQLTSRLEFKLLPNKESTALASTIEQFQQQALLVLIGLSLLFYLMLTSLLAAPLRRLSSHIDALREGQGGLLAESFTRSLPVAELEKVRHSLNDYQNQLEQMHHSLNEKNDELWTLAHRDPLTGVYNRRGFEEDWKHVRSVSSGHRLEVSLLLFDCDHFKAINDTYGHQAGDQVIQAITHSLQSTLRRGDRLYRLGGDEFATLFLDIDPDLAMQTAERCLEAVSQYDFSSLGIREPVRISAGLAYASASDAETLATLPKQADIAMYHAKRPGKKKVAVYDDSMTNDAGVLFSTSVTNAVFEAITTGESIEMHYQPVVNLANGEVDYYEALVRIRAGHELIMPSSIFPIIEARRLEAEFDFAVIGRIEKDLEQGAIPALTGISLNVSGPGVIDPKIVGKLLELGRFLNRYRLIIEITETALITQFHQASANLNKLRQDGFKIALDDFGSGYSSLGYLANMPVDIIKFDISMVRHLDAGGRQGLIVENLATMIIKAGYQMVAEGIETEKTLQNIVGIGFSRGQGYLFGRPENICRDATKFSIFNKT
ncbi:putative bifunctional diguanylate cyclase/phosphodiesterase [Sulfuricella denitrificans]|uniref:putative bifunctional diguanylate cyclase/phosphodiesterase n=1 Tax=Sulfuricella denitrificans TaxID=649841 RepID=UPI001E5FB3BA|nr:bifunctional diguanylate cyclase/phosphodiesterase [Sulfuricella denitrificans]